MDCILAGVGGQGTVLASKLIAAIAMEDGLHVRTAETIGMAQRGGSVVSHVRTGHDIASPLIPWGQADLLIGFEPGEAVRCLKYLKPQGTVVVSTTGVEPVTSSLGGSPYSGEEMLDYLEKSLSGVIKVDTRSICTQAGTDKVLNIALLGAAVGAGVLDINPQQAKDAIKAMIKPRFVPMNITAFDQGMAEAKKGK